MSQACKRSRQPGVRSSHSAVHMLAQQHRFLGAANDKPALYYEKTRRGQCTITEVDKLSGNGL